MTPSPHPWLAQFAGACLAVLLTAAPGAELEPSVTLEARAAMRRAGAYLRDRQLPTGSWAEEPPVTSLVALALANGPDAADSAAAVAAALDAIGRARQPDGAIWGNHSRQYPVYSTALSLLAPLRMARPADTPANRAARQYLLGMQDTDDRPGSVSCGGFRSAPGRGPDLTTTQYVLEALYLSDDLAADPEAADRVYRLAGQFLLRCQRLGPAVGPDLRGAFADRPDGVGTEAGLISLPAPRSPAFLTCSGLKSLIYAKVGRERPEVRAAADWVGRQMPLPADAALGPGFYTGLYAYAKARQALREPGPADAAWRTRVANLLLGRQAGSGAWQHTDAAWGENRPELATAYALLTLELACGPLSPLPATDR